MNSSQPSPGRIHSAIDNAAKIGTVLIPIVLGLATIFVTKHQQTLQLDLQSQQYRTTMDEQNKARVLRHLVGLGDPSPTNRMISAEALQAYASINRMDMSFLPALLVYLKQECDPGVADIIRATAVSITRGQQANVSKQLEQERGDQTCTSAGGESRSVIASTPASASTQIVSGQPHYFDVGCGEVNSNTLQVPLPINLKPGQKLDRTEASLVDRSNLKAGSSVQVLAQSANGATIKYTLIGLDRQLFGNCPGGGHGTVVTSFIVIGR